jgi:hypothetical protein
VYTVSKPAITIHNAKILSITPFERENWHVNLKYPERFLAISFESDGQVYVTFTRKHTPFAETAHFAKSKQHTTGERFTISGKYKRVQDYAQLGGQIVLTNCKFGVYAFQAEKAKREAKAAARHAKLFGA